MYGCLNINITQTINTAVYFVFYFTFDELSLSPFVFIYVIYSSFYSHYLVFEFRRSISHNKR